MADPEGTSGSETHSEAKASISEDAKQNITPALPRTGPTPRGMSRTERELLRLSKQTNADGPRGLIASREQEHPMEQNQRLRLLFHTFPAREHRTGSRTLKPLHSNPNIYIVERFFSLSDLEHIDELLTERRKSFKHSHTDNASTGQSLVSHERTSLSLYLRKAGDSRLRAIEARAAELVGLPADYVEPLQIVSYTDGQRFDLHHDLGSILHLGEALDLELTRSDGNTTKRNGKQPKRKGSTSRDRLRDEVIVDLPSGPRRLITLFVYLNSLPQGVGHTEFPLLPLSVRPRCGAALLFCNVLANGAPDGRTCHRACPVPRGHFKFGANIWVTNSSMQAHAVAAVPRRAKRRSDDGMVGGGGGGGGVGGGGGGNGDGGVLRPHLLADLSLLHVPPASALLGLRVRKRFGGHGSFVGRVASHCAATGFRIEYEDGDAEDLDLEELLSLPLAQLEDLIGRSVSKHFPGFGKFNGEVRSCSEEGFLVHYDDGDSEHVLPRDLVRLLAAPSSQKRRRA